MTQSISLLNATLPLTTDRSSFFSKPSNIPKSYKPKATPNSFSSIVSKTPVNDTFLTTRNTKQITNDPLTYSYTTPYSAPSSSTGGGRTPWEIKERETEYKLRFDMPGMRREDVKVWIEENMLVVQAEKTQKMKKDSNLEEQEEEEEWPAKSFGRYRRVIALPENIEFEKIKAEVKDGVLYITIPKASVSTKILSIPVQ